MAESEKAALRIRWIRSGTGFSRKQKEMVRSLGLRRLHQVVERPDTAQVRGLIARVSHLVEVVDAARHPENTPLPNYVILPPEGRGRGETVSEPVAQGNESGTEAGAASTTE